MEALALVLASLYLAASVHVTGHALAQLHLVLRRPSAPPAPAPVPDDALPTLTIQLPLRNERRVVEDLIETVGQTDWPRDRLRIQVLDDSDDDTVERAARAVERLRDRGLDAVHVRRDHPTGFKAGALRDGLAADDSDFVAVFDADFRPAPDLLRRAIRPLLEDDAGAWVQVRWAHLDRDDDPIRLAQAFHLDAHFTVEQAARARAPLLMGFNGTAGIWRRAAIDAVGGWHADTLTEDLDLAFRAQLGGWRGHYLDALEAPAELPDTLRAVRSQQFRWMKGGAQVARKLLGPLWASDRPWIAKAQGTAHLLGSSVFLSVLTLCMLGPLLPWVADQGGAAPVVLGVAGTALQGVLAILVVEYGLTCVVREGGLFSGLARLAVGLPTFLVLSTGLALHNSLAVLDGWSGRPSDFVRTPKRGGTDADGALYRPEPADARALAEVALAAWAGVGCAGALAAGNPALAGFLGAQALGFGAVGLGSLRPLRGDVAESSPATAGRRTS